MNVFVKLSRTTVSRIEEVSAQPLKLGKGFVFKYFPNLGSRGFFVLLVEPLVLSTRVIKA